MKICTFAGHANIYFENKSMVKSILKGEIINLIEKENVTTADGKYANLN